MRKAVLASLLVLGCAAIASPTLHAGDDENLIVGACAATSGGMPASFVACAAKDLTLAELRKCFDGTGCLGPGNTLVQFTDWFNRAILGNCGFHSQSAKEPQFLVMNNSSATVSYSIEAEQTDLSSSSLLPGQQELWTFPFCNTWVNVHGAAQTFSYDMGGIMEFVDGDDGHVRQYLVVGK